MWCHFDRSYWIWQFYIYPFGQSNRVRLAINCASNLFHGWIQWSAIPATITRTGVPKCYYINSFTKRGCGAKDWLTSYSFKDSSCWYTALKGRARICLDPPKIHKIWRGGPPSPLDDAGTWVGFVRCKGRGWGRGCPLQTWWVWFGPLQVLWVKVIKEAVDLPPHTLGFMHEGATHSEEQRATPHDWEEHMESKSNEIFVLQANHKLCCRTVSNYQLLCVIACSICHKPSLALPHIYCIWSVALKAAQFGILVFCYM